MRSSVDTRPFAPFEWLLAYRYLRARRKEGFISVTAMVSFVGIMLGVMTLIVVMAVMNGFRNDLFDKILGLNGHMVVYKVGEAFTDYKAKAQSIAEVPGVEGVIPLIEGQVMVSSTVMASGAAVRGVTEPDLKKLRLVAGNIQLGSLDGFDGAGGLAIGIRMASNLRVTLGDRITIITPRGAQTPFGTAPRSRSYPIVAIFELGMSEYDKSVIFMPLTEAQRFFNKREHVDVLEVLVDDPEGVQAFAAPVRAAGGPSIELSDWRQRNATFFTVLEVERNVMFIILSLIVLVAALNIISGMMMLVKEKGRDIAVLRTMGATRGAVMRIFIITGASIGIVGTLAGFLLGVVFCQNIEKIRQLVSYFSGTTLFDPSVYYLTRLPADMDSAETATIVMMAMAISIIATLYPSWRASCLDPVEALRYE